MRSFMFVGLCCAMGWSAELEAREWIQKGLAVMQEKLQKAKIVANENSQKYCSGFHCFDFSIEQCNRIGWEFCRTLEINRLSASAGHSLVALREEIVAGDHNIKRAVTCVMEPQGGALQEKACTNTAISRSADKKWKTPTPSMVCAYYGSLSEYCEKGKVKQPFNVSIRENSEATLRGIYSGWWSNAPRIDAQLLNVCQKRNAEISKDNIRAKSFPLSESMPKCADVGETIIEKGCEGVSYLRACKTKTRYGGEQCLAYYCKDESIQFVASMDELVLPSCSDDQGKRHQYCSGWRYNQALEVRKISGNYDIEQGRHICVNKTANGDLKYQEFKCEKKLESYVWTILGPLQRLR